jgi:hypothetical protein
MVVSGKQSENTHTKKKEKLFKKLRGEGVTSSAIRQSRTGIEKYEMFGNFSYGIRLSNLT